MNKLIKEQLLKCKVANIPKFDDSTTKLVIDKKVPEPEPQVNHYYIIEIEDYVINEPAGFTLSSNWNRGTKPTYKYYRVQITQAMGKMFKILGMGYDYENDCDFPQPWSGWIPRAGFHIKKEIDVRV